MMNRPLGPQPIFLHSSQRTNTQKLDVKKAKPSHPSSWTKLTKALKAAARKAAASLPLCQYLRLSPLRELGSEACDPIQSTEPMTEKYQCHKLIAQRLGTPKFNGIVYIAFICDSSCMRYRRLKHSLQLLVEVPQ